MILRKKIVSEEEDTNYIWHSKVNNQFHNLISLYTSGGMYTITIVGSNLAISYIVSSKLVVSTSSSRFLSTYGNNFTLN